MANCCCTKPDTLDFSFLPARLERHFDFFGVGDGGSTGGGGGGVTNSPAVTNSRTLSTCNFPWMKSPEFPLGCGVLLLI